MSETDDTDELLLIPPDLFASNQALDNFGPYYTVVDSLITQVTHLENRINFIESSSEFSISLIDSPEMQSPSRAQDRFSSMSAQNTPQKPLTKFTVNSLPNSPDVDHLKKRTPKKGEINPMLGEIDSFLSNVKLIKRLNAVRNLEGDFHKADVTNTKKLDLNQVNQMLKEVELQDKKLEAIERPFVKEKLWQAGDNIDSCPDYGYGMRKNMYPESKTTYTVNGIDSSLDKVESDSSSECTQSTAFDKFKYKSQGQKNLESGDYNLGLVSLAKLWNSQDLRELPSKFQQKLQEERLRRQHCEKSIQELQKRVLELQERVAVAVQVDEAKDKAILRFHESWEKNGSKLQDIERQKERLEEEVERLRKKLDEDVEETNQKIAYYEREAALALDIAHSSQDKLAVLEKKYAQLEEELKVAENRSEEFHKKYSLEVEKNRQFPEILAQKELELNECKSVLVEARKEVAQSKRAVEVCQSELLVMKNENNALLSKLDVEKDNNKRTVEQKNKLVEEVSAHKSIAKGLQEELVKARDQMETSKMELKNFYQGQVELVVQSKLKEFQSQLDEAEKALKDELSKKELAIAKAAASHIQQISEKHSLEIKLVEEKHQEESRLYQLQISQLRHELDDSNLKIKRQNEKHLHIEKQLNKFMESLKQDHLATPEEVNSFRSKSFNNLEEILSFNMVEDGRGRKAELDDSQGKIGETPLTSRNEKGRRREGSLQETIQMLLEKKGQWEEGLQVTRDGGQKMAKDARGKRPWK